MSVVLNFQKKDISQIEKALAGLEKMPPTSQYEFSRFKDNENVVVIFSSGKTVIQGKKPERTKEFLLKNLGLSEELVLGFDEAGRGEKNGPMVIVGVLADTNRMREIRDSKKTKKISEKAAIVSENFLASSSFTLNAAFLDRLRKKGLNLNQLEAKIIQKTIEAFEELSEKPRTVVDGNPLEVKAKNTEFLVKGDDLEPVVGAASVTAKFLRENSKDKAKRETWKNNP